MDKYTKRDRKAIAYNRQRNWYLELYGFESKKSFRDFLADKQIIFDAGCGLGYKAAWFAELAHHALVIGMDFSEAARVAAETYLDIPNLIFIQGDIANTRIVDGACDYVSCDQVIMHTEDPEATFAELARITAQPNGQIACYFYAKKALPRELLDDYFRKRCLEVTHEDLWALSERVTELGESLTNLKVTIDVPHIPLLGIEGGRMDFQRFIYWNFMKFFYNDELGHETSTAANLTGTARPMRAGSVKMRFLILYPIMK